MRITHRMIADTVNYNLQGSLRRLENYSNQLSTGKLFQRPSQNPVGVGRVMGYSASISRNEQFRLNMNQSQGWLENTESALQNSIDVMQRIRELSIYGATESLTAEDRRAIAPEVLEFIDHLIGIANTESNGLYIFGGHQTLKAPFLRENVYGVKTHDLRDDHVGYAEYHAGEIIAGTAGREIELEFMVDGDKYTVSALSEGSAVADTFNNIKEAVEKHPRLGKHISVDGDATDLTFSRITAGDFTVKAVNQEAVAVIENLTGADPTGEALAADQNIASLSGISANSFFAGEYKVLTDKINSGDLDQPKPLVYSQSGDVLVDKIEAGSPSHNQSVSFTVTEVSENNVTLSYQYKQMDPATGAVTSGFGSVTVDPGVDNVVTIGAVDYTVNLKNDAEFTIGDRMVVNTHAEIDTANIVQLYRDEESNPLFTFAFAEDVLDNDGPHSFEFYSLDVKSGALLESSMDLDWGVNDFVASTDLNMPAAGFTVNVLGEDGSFAERTEKVVANGLQNGAYQLQQNTITAAGDYSSDINVVQSYTQGSAASLLTGSADPKQVTMEVQSEDKNASILLKVREIDLESGQIKYDYSSHQYDRDGNYNFIEGVATLSFGGDNIQTVNIGDIEVQFTGLDTLSADNTRGLVAGDRAVIDIRAAVDNNTTYNQLALNGEHRGSDSQANFIFADGNVAEKINDLRYFSLDTFERSPEKGRVYDGKLMVNEDTLELLRLPQNQTFHYDISGFPVYYGDNLDRVQEISPHQEVIMNLSGDKAFGDNQEIFEAVYSVYWALIDNDREALGGEALEKMDRAVDRLLESLSQVGARSNRVDAMQNTLLSENHYLREVRSNIEDIDLAEVITEFTMQENAYRAALSTAAMMLQPSLIDYLR